MRIPGTVVGLAVGAGFGLLAALFLGGAPQYVIASGNDRFQDYVMATGAVTINPRVPMDGVWMLDYRAGKLLGTVIDRAQGKIIGWAEVDLVSEFGVQPRTNVHFMMTTGMVASNQAALYVAETTSGKFGVYTMGPRPDGAPGISIKRHDIVMFRQAKAN